MSSPPSLLMVSLFYKNYSRESLSQPDNKTVNMLLIERHETLYFYSRLGLNATLHIFTLFTRTALHLRHWDTGQGTWTRHMLSHPQHFLSRCECLDSWPILKPVPKAKSKLYQFPLLSNLWDRGVIKVFSLFRRTEAQQRRPAVGVRVGGWAEEACSEARLRRRGCSALQATASASELRAVGAGFNVSRE